MTAPTHPYGFRIVGALTGARRLIDHATAFRAHAECDQRAELHRECYLSAFAFGADFREHLEATGSTAGFTGPTWSPWLWFDVDRANLDEALCDARALMLLALERYVVSECALLVFFSGSKGFHLGIPTALFGAAPALDFHLLARTVAERLAGLAGVQIDTGVYDRVRAFRAPNSRHPRSGLHKRHLSVDELQGLSLEAILQMAREPSAFEVPDPPAVDAQAVEDWIVAIDTVAAEAKGKAELRAALADGARPARLNRATLDFIRDGALTGDRHRLLFSAASNLAEFGCPPALAHALLTEAALDSGLPPGEVRRQILCGLTHGAQQQQTD